MNLANKLTMFRMLCVPAYYYIALYTGYDTLALVLFSLAAFTDFLDGYVARKYSMITSLGKLMDPLADKFLTITAFTVFMYKGSISPGILLIITLREILISVFRAVAASKDLVIAASIYGKLKTLLQMSTIIVIHIMYVFKIERNLPVDLLVGLMALISLISAVDYIWKNKEVIGE